jgi:hypothetical protein
VINLRTSVIGDDFAKFCFGWACLGHYIALKERS